MISFSKEYSFDEFSNLLRNYPRIISEDTTPLVDGYVPDIMSYSTQNDTIISIINNMNPNIPTPHTFYKLDDLSIVDDGPLKNLSISPEGSPGYITLWASMHPGIRFKIIKFDGQKQSRWSSAKKIFPVLRLAGPSAQISAAERTYAPGNPGARPVEERFNIGRDIQSAYNIDKDVRDKVAAAQTLQQLSIHSTRRRDRSPNKNRDRSRSRNRGGKKFKKKYTKKKIRKGSFKTRKYKKTKK